VALFVRFRRRQIRRACNLNGLEACNIAEDLDAADSVHDVLQKPIQSRVVTRWVVLLAVQKRQSAKFWFGVFSGLKPARSPYWIVVFELLGNYLVPTTHPTNPNCLDLVAEVGGVLG